MTIKLYVVDECGDEWEAEAIDSRKQEILGDSVENYVEFRLAQLADRYPEARYIYREDQKTYGEMMCDRYTETYEYWLKYAEENPEEVGDWDPEEWADEQARDEMDNQDPYFGGW